VGFIVGGVGVATGTVLLLVDPRVFAGEDATTGGGAAKSSAGVSWSPFVGIGTAGVKGSF
jgi:hypothetical protein